jgi:hypothetical protein
MAKRGRPNKSGAKPGWMFFRSAMILVAYDRARRRGEKHYAAVAAVVLALRARVPEMPISETEVKRVLAHFRPETSRVALIFTESLAQGREAETWLESLKWAAKKYCGRWDVPMLSADESKPRLLSTFAIHFGLRPCYPRHNARS